MTAGQCVAPFAFYGYLKSEEDKHKLVMDKWQLLLYGIFTT